MPHIYIPDIWISKHDYDMIQNNDVPIDCFIANKVREESMFVYIQETDATYKRARNYEWCPELESRIISNDLSENPDKRSTICDI